MVIRFRQAAGFAALVGLVAPQADASCVKITAPMLELGVVDCATVLPKLQATGQFPDVFAPPGKAAGLCYATTAPAPAVIGKRQVSLSGMSAWTTDFVPFLLGGTDNLGTVVTQIAVTGTDGNAVGNYYTRDTIDLSQLVATDNAPEEDVIVGGTSIFVGVSGTYRVASAPEDQQASKVLLTNLNGLVCSAFW